MDLATSQNTGNKRPAVVINKYPERQTDFSRPPVAPGTTLVKLLYLQNVKETFRYLLIAFLRGFVLENSTVS